MRIRPPSSWWCYCTRTKTNQCEYYQPPEDSSTCVYKIRGKCENKYAVKEGWVNISILKKLEEL